MQKPSPSRKPTNLTLDASLLTEARSLGVNLSQAAESGLRPAVAEAHAELWRQTNAAALASSNTWVDEHGLPLDAFRRF